MGEDMKKILVIGAGPAGLTAAYELLNRAKGDVEVVVFEESLCYYIPRVWQLVYQMHHKMIFTAALQS